ncbi:MAG: prepilin peptidase [Sphingomicrobium sp.]
MNLFSIAPEWAVWLLAAALVAAAVEDALRLSIANLFPLLIIGLAVVVAVRFGVEAAVWQNGLVFAGLLAAGTLVFATGKMGGGDVKLFAALGLHCDLKTAVMLVSSTFIIGGALALLMIASRLLVPAGAAGRLSALKRGAGIPYGVAIAAGGLLTLFLQRS